VLVLADGATAALRVQRVEDLARDAVRVGPVRRDRRLDTRVVRSDRLRAGLERDCRSRWWRGRLHRGSWRQRRLGGGPSRAAAAPPTACGCAARAGRTTVSRSQVHSFAALISPGAIARRFRSGCRAKNSSLVSLLASSPYFRRASASTT